VSDLFAATDLVYVRRPPGFLYSVGGGGEHWDVTDGSGGVVATVDEASLPVLQQAARYWNAATFPKKLRRRLQMRDSTGGVLFEMIRQPPKLGLEYVEVRTADGVPVSTVRLIRPAGSDQLGLGLYDRHDVRLAEVREAGEKMLSSGHRAYDMLAGDGSPIGTLITTKAPGAAEPSDYRLRIARELSEPLRSLVYAAPIGSYFMW
jgi:hypothetical protein